MPEFLERLHRRERIASVFGLGEVEEADAVGQLERAVAKTMRRVRRSWS
jgi:hypothetical protein